MREAVVQLAETLAPDADVRGYLALPLPGSETLNSLQAAFLSWGHDPYAFAIAGDEDAPAWRALTEARATLAQALGDGAVLAMVLGEQGRDVGVPANTWRAADAVEVLRLEAQEGRTKGWTLHIEAAGFTTWLQRRQSLARRTDHVSAETATQKWLAAEMHAHPDGSPLGPKAAVQVEAEKQFGVNGRAFERAWRAAQKEVPAQTWGNPGAKSKRQSKRQ